MIPKIIHYCWFGRGEKPELAKKCIASWKKFCPDFEIREWNEDNCDYLAMPFMAEAYAAKKYAFVSSSGGYFCPVKDANALYEAMQRVMELSVEQRSEMGCRGRERMEQQFSKTAVVTETIKHLEI